MNKIFNMNLNITASCHLLYKTNFYCVHRKLDVSHNSGVSGIGLRRLWSTSGETARHSWNPDAATYGQCTKLTFLDVTETSVSSDSAILAIRNLPELSKLRHTKYDDVLEQFVTHHKNQVLKLDYISFSFHSQSMDVIDQICQTVPHAKILEIKVLKVPLSTELLKLDKMTELKIDFYRNACYQVGAHSECKNIDIMSYLSQSQCLFNLTKIELLYRFPKVDVSIIGHHCLKLEILTIGCEISNEPKYKLNISHFSKLREIDFRSSEYWSKRAIPANVLLSLLSSPVLEKLCMLQFEIPAQIISELLLEAKTHERVFSNLKHLMLANCHDILSRYLEELIMVAPQLRTIKVYNYCKVKSCGKLPVNLDSVHNTVHANGLFVKITPRCNQKRCRACYSLEEIQKLGLATLKGDGSISPAWRTNFV